MEGVVRTSTETVAVPIANLDVVRSWKDPKYRRSLSAQQLESLPNHPAGPAMLADQDLKAASGISLDEDFSIPLTTALGCTELTFHGWKSCGC